jgi:hypothetical protein
MYVGPHGREPSWIYCLSRAGAKGTAPRWANG